MKKFFRKNYLISPAFQFQFIAMSLLLTFSIIATIYISNSYFFETFIEKGRAINLPDDHFYFQLIHEQKVTMNSFFILLSLMISIAVCAFGIFISHRIAGPLHRLKVYFDKKEMEQERKLNFRKGDYFQDIPIVINRFFFEKNKNE